MNNLELESLLGPLLGKQFGGVWPCDLLPIHQKLPTPCGYVVNTHPHTQSGEHWLAIFLENEARAEFFDSFGFPPDHPYYPRDIWNFLIKNGREINYNQLQVQEETSVVCGQHCVFFLCQRARGLNMQKVMELYTNDPKKNDIMVDKFVKKYQRCLKTSPLYLPSYQNACSLQTFKECHHC